MKAHYIILTVLLCSGLIACKQEVVLYKLLPAEKTGISFVNQIDETDDFNILTYEYIYNGAGVAAADFNGNGYQDLFFVGNMTQNRFYINHGDFSFEDVTSVSGVSGNNEKWYSGVSVIDINNDGLPDIYISATGRDDPKHRRNELYINQGLDENGTPVFVEKAAEYSIDDNSYTTQGYFFDYNNDGILDLYLMVSQSASSSYTNVTTQQGSNADANRDKLFEGLIDDKTGKITFKDISIEAGINKEGYGLGVNIIDINDNGLKDIYVANDYISEDLFWINNGDGTFSNKAPELFKHFSFSAMGTDAGDLNNNGLLDIFTLDMLPNVNVRRKMMANPNNYRNYVNNAFQNVHPQYTRNTLQMNLGPADSTNTPVFSEVALMSGVAATDWSWTTLLADFDNDGYRDILVTNGIPRDVTDKDFWDEYGRVRNIMPMSLALPKIPEVKIPNFLFRNNGPDPADNSYVTFSDHSVQWGFDTPTYSTGAVYADLNNNGSLDLVINNINQPAFIYRNTFYDQGNSEDANRWLKVEFRGANRNSMGVGAKVDLYFDGDKHQTYEHTIQKGYLSTVDSRAHFGLGTALYADSLIVTWPKVNGTEGMLMRQKFEHPETNRIIQANYSNAEIYQQQETKISPLFKDVTAERGISYENRTQPINGFSRQPLVPYQFSTHGIGAAKGDLNGNGLEDLFIGSGGGQQAVILYHQPDGTFQEVLFEPEGESFNPEREDVSVIIFDANGNGHNDIYIASGGVQNDSGHNYTDRFYLNNGEGAFTRIHDALPSTITNGSVVSGGDYNENGKTDLFIGGQRVPGRYPEPVSSIILRNDSNLESVKFTDVTDEVAPMLRNFGIVNDAKWTDFNGDGTPDLIIAAEWKPITLLENRNGIFADVTKQSGIDESKGLWFSITETDLTGDGHLDYIAGNLGLNSLLKATPEEPLSIYYGDLTEDGFFEAIPTIYIEETSGIKKEFPYHNREDVFWQIPEIGNRIQNHRNFGLSVISDILTPDQLDNASVNRINDLQSSVLVNKGDGTFQLKPLPISAQVSPIFDILAKDFDGDVNVDLVVSGNLLDADLQTGSYNAMNGLFLQGVGQGTFSMERAHNSGIRIPGDSRSIFNIRGRDGESLIFVIQHNGPVKLFEYRPDSTQ